MATPVKTKLGELFIRAGVIDELQLRAALGRQRDYGGKLGQCLVALGFTDTRTVGRALAKQAGVPAMDPTTEVVDLTLLQHFPERLATENRCLPFKREGKSACVVISEPGNLARCDVVTSLFGRGVKFFIAAEHAILELIERAYRAFEYGALVLEPVPEDRNLVRAQHLPSKEQSEASAAHFPGQWVDAPVEAQAPAVAEEVGPALESIRASLDDALEKAFPTQSAAQPQAGPPRALPKIFLFDPDTSRREELRLSLRRDGYEVQDAAEIEEARKRLAKAPPQLIVLSVSPKNPASIKLARALKEGPLKEVPLVLLSDYFRGWRDAEDLRRLTGAHALLEKPLAASDLSATIKCLLRLEGTPGDQVARSHANRLLARGRALYEQGKIDLAAECFMQAVEYDGSIAAAHQALATVHENAGDLYKALVSYESAAKLEPENFLIFKKLTLIYEKLGFQSKAFEALERSARTCPNENVRQRIIAHLKTRL